MRSMRQVAREAVREVAVALALGGLIFVPLAALIIWRLRVQASAPSYHQESYRFETMPPDDRALTEWARSQPDLQDLSVKRKEDEVRMSYESTRTGTLDPPWSALGYETVLGTFSGVLPPVTVRIRLLFYFFLLARCTDLWLLRGCLRARRLLAGTKDAGRAPSRRRGVLVGVLAGLALFAIVLGIDFGLGKIQGLAPVWSGWGSVILLAPWARWTLVPLVPFLLACVEGTFFFGIVYPRFAEEGFAGKGAVVTAALFGAVQCSPIDTPVCFLLGLALCWLRRRTGSALAPTLALATALCVQAIWIATAASLVPAVLTDLFGRMTLK